jgi:hypothetical protein
VSREQVYRLIEQERQRQTELFPDAETNGDFVWAAVLGEEFGEVCRAALMRSFSGGPVEDLRSELVQVAAVAVAWLEFLDAEPIVDGIES